MEPVAARSTVLLPEVSSLVLPFRCTGALTLMAAPEVLVVFASPDQTILAPSLPGMGRRSRVENWAAALPGRGLTVATPPPFTSMARALAVVPEVMPCSRSNSLSVTSTVLPSRVTGPWNRMKSEAKWKAPFRLMVEPVTSSPSSTRGGLELT